MGLHKQVSHSIQGLISNPELVSFGQVTEAYSGPCKILRRGTLQYHNTWSYMFNRVLHMSLSNEKKNEIKMISTHFHVSFRGCICL